MPYCILYLLSNSDSLYENSIRVTFQPRKLASLKSQVLGSRGMHCLLRKAKLGYNISGVEWMETRATEFFTNPPYTPHISKEKLLLRGMNPGRHGVEVEEM